MPHGSACGNYNVTMGDQSYVPPIEMSQNPGLEKPTRKKRKITDQNETQVRKRRKTGEGDFVKHQRQVIFQKVNVVTDDSILNSKETEQNFASKKRSYKKKMKKLKELEQSGPKITNFFKPIQIKTGLTDGVELNNTELSLNMVAVGPGGGGEVLTGLDKGMGAEIGCEIEAKKF